MARLGCRSSLLDGRILLEFDDLATARQADRGLHFRSYDADQAG
jgi:hypothetical protein